MFRFVTQRVDEVGPIFRAGIEHVPADHDDQDPPTQQESLPTHDTAQGASPRAAPALVVRVRTFWVLVSPQSKVTITCALYRTPGGLELRAGQGEHDLLLVQKVVGNGTAEAFARAWHRLAIAQGYQDTSPPPAQAEPSLRVRILDWLWRGHTDATHRTPTGIAAMLNVNEHDVRRELAAMRRAALVHVVSIEGNDAYYAAPSKDR